MLIFLSDSRKKVWMNTNSRFIKFTLEKKKKIFYKKCKLNVELCNKLRLVEKEEKKKTEREEKRHYIKYKFMRDSLGLSGNKIFWDFLVFFNLHWRRT